MQLPDDSIIPEDKITRYLLVPRIKDDKSKFLAQAGFTQENPEELLIAIRLFAATNEAIEESTNEYGTFYIVGEHPNFYAIPWKGIATQTKPTSVGYKTFLARAGGLGSYSPRL